MATYETWSSKNFGSESNLKFWLEGETPLEYVLHCDEYSCAKVGDRWSLVTVINEPHTSRITAFTFCLDRNAAPLLLTASADGRIKKWSTFSQTRGKKGA